MVQMMALLATWKWTASVSTRKTTTKKSKASRVQPKKLAATACRAPEREGVDGEAGVGFEKFSLFSSVAAAYLAGEVYTAGCGNYQKAGGEAPDAHGPSVRKDFTYRPGG